MIQEKETPVGFHVAIFWTVEHSHTDSSKLCAIGNKQRCVENRVAKLVK